METDDPELAHDAPGWHHSHDGWFWRRCSRGDVAIVKRVDVPGFEHKLLGAHRLTAAEWASIVAHVSARGETAATHEEALELHRKVSPRDPAGASYERAVEGYRAARALDVDDTLDERPAAKDGTPR